MSWVTFCFKIIQSLDFYSIFGVDGGQLKFEGNMFQIDHVVD